MMFILTFVIILVTFFYIDPTISSITNNLVLPIKLLPAIGGVAQALLIHFQIL